MKIAQPEHAAGGIRQGDRRIPDGDSIRIEALEPDGFLPGPGDDDLIIGGGGDLRAGDERVAGGELDAFGAP